MAAHTRIPRALNDFMCICFHEEMTDDYPASSCRESAHLAVVDYFNTQRLDKVKQLQIELSHLVATVISESELDSMLRGLRWNFAPWRGWLELLLQQFNDFLTAQGEQIHRPIAIPTPAKDRPPHLGSPAPPTTTTPRESAAAAKWIIGICLIVALLIAFFRYLPNARSSQGNRTPSSDDQQIRALIANWSAAHSTNDIATEASFYAPNVDSYFLHRHVSRAFILKSLQAGLDRGNHLTVYQADVVSINVGANGTANIALDKHWSTKTDANSPHHTRSRLKARRIMGTWLIVFEADLSDRQDVAPNIEVSDSTSAHLPRLDFQFNIMSTRAQANDEHQLEFTYTVKGVGESTNLPYSNFVAHPVADGQELSDIKLYSRTLGMFDADKRGTILFDVVDSRMTFDTTSSADGVCNYLHVLHPDWTAFRLHNPYGPINADFAIPCAFASRP